jgi:hypothetical protein
MPAPTCGYHFTAKPICRSKGQNAVHTAAYNARTQLYDEREGRETKDYGQSKSQSAVHTAAYNAREQLNDEREGRETKHYGKQGEHSEAQFTGIFAPKDAPAWCHDREQLWNHAEAAEKRKDGQTARNVEFALPAELTPEQRKMLVTDYARETFARRGMIADVAIHAPSADGDQRNYHVHCLLTMRKLDGEEFSKTKCREWNSRAELEMWREKWAEKGANYLERAGHHEEAERWRHGHEKLEDQRAAALERGDKEFAESIDRVPTQHKGANVTAMEKRNEAGERGDEQRDQAESNALRMELRGVDRSIAEEEERRKREETGQELAGELYRRGGMVEQQRDAMKHWRERNEINNHAPERRERGEDNGQKEIGDMWRARVDHENNKEVGDMRRGRIDHESNKEQTDVQRERAARSSRGSRDEDDGGREMEL